MVNGSTRQSIQRLKGLLSHVSFWDVGTLSGTLPVDIPPVYTTFRGQKKDQAEMCHLWLDFVALTYTPGTIVSSGESHHF